MTKEEKRAVICPTCGADVGKECRTINPRSHRAQTTTHKARLERARAEMAYRELEAKQ